MADNVTFQKTATATPPTGTIVAADVVDGVAYQRVKISVGEDGVASDSWKDQKFDYTSGDLDYKGLSVTHNAATDAGDLWSIWKYTWVGDNPTRIEGPIIGNWDDRAGLSWG